MEDYFLGKAPPLTSNIKCYVFDNYVIQEYNEEIVLPEINNSYFNDGTSSSPRHVYENYSFNESIKVKAKLPRGKYIHWSYSEIKRVYNPVEEDPDIFVKFVELGSENNLTDNKILRFVNKYGLLKYYEHRGFDIKYGFPYNIYPVEAFKAYASEASFIFRLYALLNEATSNEMRKKELRNHLLRIDEFIPEGFRLFQEIINFNSYLFKWWKQLSNHVKIELIGYFPQEKTCDEKNIEVFILDQENLKYDARKIPLIPALGFDDVTFWEQFFNEAPIEAVIEAASELIASITNLRIKDDILFSTTVETDEQGRLFKQHWTSPSLLTIMWYLFYLEITGQMDQRYKICKHCSKPIYPEEGKEKVHGRRNFHDGCRQKYNQDTKKQAKAMYKEGKSISEIGLNFPTTKKKTIEKWLNED